MAGIEPRLPAQQVSALSITPLPHGLEGRYSLTFVGFQPKNQSSVHLVCSRPTTHALQVTAISQVLAFEPSDFWEAIGSADIALNLGFVKFEGLSLLKTERRTVASAYFCLILHVVKKSLGCSFPHGDLDVLC